MVVIKSKKRKNYSMPTEVYFGRGSIFILPELLKKIKRKKILLVAGEHFCINEENKKLIQLFRNTGRVEFYSHNIKKSSFEEINLLVRFVIKGKFDGIIGLGGGAILDCSKVASVLATNGGKVEDYLVQKKRKIGKPGIVCVAIPTTSGTGSEVTPWSVVWGEKKYSLQSDYMFPKYAIVDAALTDDCPRYITATSGIDAITQAIEAYWNVKHNPTSDKYALESIKLIMENLEKAVKSPTNSVRNKMAEGSLKGGLAFSNTATTICHAVSYPMTSHWGVTHGQATSITLPIFIEYTFEILGSRENAILKAIGAKNKKEAAKKIKDLIKRIGLKTRLRDLGIPKYGIDVIVKEGFDPARAKNSPKIPTPKELHFMLSSIF